MRTLAFFFVSSLLLAACGNDPEIIVPTDMGATDASSNSDAGSDLGAPVDAGNDAAPPLDGGSDLGTPVDASTTDLGPPVDMGMCIEAANDDGLFAGVGCGIGEFECPSDYECFSFTGIVAGPPHCEIPCTADCECPDDFSCTVVSDKSGIHQFCRLPSGACTDVPADNGANAGVACDPGASECGAGYECAAFSGGTTTYSCEIKCRADCECPAGFACNPRSDASGTRRYCESEVISSDS